jgi:hypothetical protein
MVVSCLVTNSPRPTPVRLGRLDVSTIDESAMADALRIVRPIYNRLGATDKVAKGTELLRRLKRKLAKDLPKTKGKARKK